MKETFDEYKKTLEDNFINFTYLYDGDVISSYEKSYSKKIEHDSISPSMIIEAITDLYTHSFNRMIDKSIEVKINYKLEDLSTGRILKMLNNIVKDPIYLFSSKPDLIYFNVDNTKMKSGPFPSFFYKERTLNSVKCDLYSSPLIEKEEDVVVLYVTDASIQSLVYSIQNMEYGIDGKIHSLTYPFYECDFNSYKVIIKDIAKDRDEKIEKILLG